MKLNNRQYKLFLKNYQLVNNEKLDCAYILISSSTATHLNNLIFNEKLTENANNQITFTFDVYNGNDFPNPFLEMLTIDRELRLIIDDEIYDFNIVKKNPTFSTNSTSYKIDCQDNFSYSLSRSGNISISTNDATIWSDNKIQPRTIKELSSKILELSKTNWTINENLNNIAIHFPDNLWNSLDEMKVSLELDNTTPYNALMEVGKLFNAIVYLNFKDKQINFLNKERLTYQGLTLNPEVNLSQFSTEESGDNLYNIMHVTGGEDGYGNYISIVPSMPYILATILIELSTITEIPLEINEDNYYNLPHFFYDGTDVYKKNLTNTISQTYYSIDKLDLVSWNQCATIDDLKNCIIAYWLEIPDYERDVNDKILIENFFHELKLIPHAASFLYDFSYWVNCKLLSESRYNQLVSDLTVNLRNINLLSMAYQLQFNYLNYELQKLIDQEEEYITAIAAEEYNRANLKEETNLSKDLYYIGHAKPVAVDGVTKYYIPVAKYINSKAYYGQTSELGTIYYSIPDLENILSNTNVVYTIIDDTPKSWKVFDVNISNDTFRIQSRDNDVTIYVDYDNIKNMTDQSLNLSNGVDGLIDLEIYNLHQKINNLHSSSYHFLWTTLHGKTWLQERKNVLNEQIAKYSLEKQSIETRLKTKFGGDWRSLDVTLDNSNTSLFIEYSNLIQQYDSLSRKIGGVGSRKNAKNEFYTYKGYLEHYYLVLDSLSNDNIQIKESLTELIKRSDNQRKSWWTNFYKRYWDVIREVSYEDAEQIDSRGLYLSAEKQFNLYKKPNQSYQLSAVSTNDLIDEITTINIGDIIYLQHNQINLKEVENFKIFAFSDKQIVINKQIAIIQVVRENISHQLYADIISTYDQYIVVNIHDYKKGDQIQGIILDQKLFSFQGSKRIIWIKNYVLPERVKMRITGIEYQLNSKSAKLIVEENTLYNTLIDRLLMLIRN